MDLNKKISVLSLVFILLAIPLSLGLIRTPTRFSKRAQEVPITPPISCPNLEKGNLDCDLKALINEADLTILLQNWLDNLGR